MSATKRILAAALLLALGACGESGETGTTTLATTSPTTPPPSTSTTVPAVDAAVAGSLQEAIDGWIAGSTSAGVAAAVRFPGGAEWRGAAGYADEVDRVEMETDDRFRVASITKMVTAAAVSSLVEEGALGLDDPVAGLLPDSGLDPALTVRHLLGHRSGLWNYTLDPGLAAGAWSPSPREVLEAAVDAGPMFPPGSRFAYSNTNYVVLGLVLEAVTGRPAHAVIRARILDPLEMRHTHLAGPELGEIEAAPGGDPGAAVAFTAWTDGALVSNAGDLVQFAASLFGGDLLDAATVDEMATEAVAGSGYGLGVEILEFGGHRALGHRGGIEGYLGGVFCLPETGVCLAVLSNDWRGGNLWALVETLADIAAG